MTSACPLLLLGYFKKVGIADGVAPYVEQAFADPGVTSAPTLLLSLYLFGRFVEEGFNDLFGEQGKWMYLFLYVSALFVSLMPTYAKHKDDQYYMSLGASGAVSAIVTVGIVWQRNDKGQGAPVEVPGTEKKHPAQLVLLAMGFLGPEQMLLKDLEVETDPRSNVKAEHGRYATNIKGVFAAGDCRRGQSLVVWAINEGRGAARECDRFLMGSTELP